MWRFGADALLGPLNRGFHIMMSVLDKGRIGIGALAVGIAQAGLEAALDYAKTRKQFGKAIAENQGLQWILADMQKDITAARALVHRAAMVMDAGLPATMDCSIAKCFAGDAAVQHTANAVQVFGGSGYIRGFEVERLYRDAKITQIYEGTNQIQRTHHRARIAEGAEMNPFEATIGASVTCAKTVAESDVYLFAGITGDLSPNHVDEVAMAGTRYGGRIAHGALLVGYMSRASTMIGDKCEALMRGSLSRSRSAMTGCASSTR